MRSKRPESEALKLTGKRVPDWIGMPESARPTRNLSASLRAPRTVALALQLMVRSSDRKGTRGDLMTHIQMGRRLSRAVLAWAAVIAAVGALAVPAQAAAAPSRLWAWGMGPLGIGTTGTRTHAVPVHGLPAFPIKQV